MIDAQAAKGDAAESLRIFSLLTRAQFFDQHFGYRRCLVQGLMEVKDLEAITALINLMPKFKGLVQSDVVNHLSAATGQEALAVLEEDVPRLLVIGVGLPLMSGWKLIEALTHYPDLSRIPRLLVDPGDELAHVCRRSLETLAERPKTADGDPTPTPVGAHRRMANA